MSLAKFIEKIPNDKKKHLILGLILNPIVFILCSNMHLALVISLGIHAFIEIWQLVTKKGKFEVLDFVAGSYSALVIYLIILIK